MGEGLELFGQRADCTEFAVEIPWPWAVHGLVFCTAVGLVFGMWPAVKASRLAPVEALRHE